MYVNSPYVLHYKICKENISMAEAARITPKFQITLPKKIRERLGAKVGDILIFLKEDDGWKISLIPGDPIAALKKAGRPLTGTVEEVHEEFEKGWEEQ
jgi:AbrB family looped-hinge helix DNA binding protein